MVGPKLQRVAKRSWNGRTMNPLVQNCSVGKLKQDDLLKENRGRPSCLMIHLVMRQQWLR
jgi:hypothetical protein